METKRANRQVCDVDFRVLATKEPFMFFEDANTTSIEMSADNVYAMSKGTKKIAFANPMDATMTIECQVAPFRLYSLMSDGLVESTATYAEVKEIACSTAGQLTLPTYGTSGSATGTIVTGSVFVYPLGEIGLSASKIVGNIAEGVFTATQTTDIAVETTYAVCYLVERTSGVQKISFRNDKLPQDLYVTMKTVDKAEDGTLIPMAITIFKGTPQRNVSLSFSSDGDPATLTITLDCMEDADGNQVEMVEIID